MNMDHNPLAKQHATEKHTPGPWRVAKDSELLDADGIVCLSPNGWEIRPDGKQRLENEMADLRLIAAAPELLAMLREVQIYLSPSGSMHRSISALISQVVRP